jgi:hypothetical protein
MNSRGSISGRTDGGSALKGWLKALLDRPISGRRLVFIFAISVTLFLSNGRLISEVDSTPNSVLPISIIVHHSLTFDAFQATPTSDRDGIPSLVTTPHGLVTVYPIATGLMATPIYFPVVVYKLLFAAPSPAEWVLFGFRFQKIAAAIIAAVAVVMFRSLCAELGFSNLLSAALTLWFALGSELFTTGGQALWQHGPGTLAIIGAVRSHARLQRESRSSDALWLSVWCGLAVAIRPSNLVAIAPFALSASLSRPRLLLPLALPAAAILGSVIGYNFYFFSQSIGGYGFLHGNFSPANFVDGLEGLLFSPSRGLLFFFPAAFAALAIVLACPKVLRDPNVYAGLAAIGLSIGLFSFFKYWWAGYAFGPRYMSEIEPLCLMIIGLAWQHLSSKPQHRWAQVLFGVLMPYSIAVHAVGAYSVAALRWNGQPYSVDAARVWVFPDNQILRGLMLTRPAPP